MDSYLLKPGWRGEVLGLSTGQDALPFLRIGGGGGRVSGGVGEKWEEGRKWKF